MNNAVYYDEQKLSVGASCRILVVDTKLCAVHHSVQQQKNPDDQTCCKMVTWHEQLWTTDRKQMLPTGNIRDQYISPGVWDFVYVLQSLVQVCMGLAVRHQADASRNAVDVRGHGQTVVHH